MKKNRLSLAFLSLLIAASPLRAQDTLQNETVEQKDKRMEWFSQAKLVGAHCKNHNSHSIGICYIGGLDDGGTTPKDTRTEAQKATLRKLIEQLHQRYPKALIVGHHDLNPQKACPCFHVTAEYIDLQP